jgi:deoxyguanosine kinase
LSQQTRHSFRYIIVEGAIGVGKTSLARLLQEHFDSALLLEVFEENPFLSKFYQSRAQYAFQTQMFFLLSRYRQQQHVPQLLQERSIISDYMFSKDWLFAKLNLAGDEWEVYQQLHNALAERIPAPDLIVYLKADTDVLLARIAQRDRPYERDMDGEYIEALRQAYEGFFSEYRASPVLTIDTNPLDFVANREDLNAILGRIRSVVENGVVQQSLPQFDPQPGESLASDRPQSLADYQRFHVELDQAKGFITDLYFNYLCLSEEMGELGSELAQLWREETHLRLQGQPGKLARQLALKSQKSSLESELADCMAFLLKIANYAGIDLESAYLEKMHYNQGRSWSHRS